MIWSLPVIAGCVVGGLLLLLILVVAASKFSNKPMQLRSPVTPESWALPETNEQKAKRKISPILEDLLDKDAAVAYLNKLKELHAGSKVSGIEGRVS